MKQKYTGQELLDILQKFYDINNRAPKSLEIAQLSSIKRHFGTWNKALQILNIPLNQDTANHIDKTRKYNNCTECGKSIIKTRGHRYCFTCAAKIREQNPNNYLVQKDRALARKIQLVLKLGGKCSVCGYDKNLSSLCFHHDTGEKEIQLDSRKLGNTSLEKLLLELEKCVLKCHNCHTEGHHPQYNNWKENILSLSKSDLECFCSTIYVMEP